MGLMGIQRPNINIYIYDICIHFICDIFFVPVLLHVFRVMCGYIDSLRFPA